MSDRELERSRGFWKAGARLAVVGAGVVIIWIGFQAMRQLLGLPAGRTVRLRRKILVNAPIESVFDFWRNFSNYSRFMSYVQSVTVNNEGGLRWRIAGPAKFLVQWDADVTRMNRHRQIAWRSRERSPVMNEGKVFFFEAHRGMATEVEVELAFGPPAGALGYAVAQLLGFDPRAKIDDDMRRMKALIESEARTRRSIA